MIKLSTLQAFNDYGALLRPFGPTIFHTQMSDENFELLKTAVDSDRDGRDARDNLAGNLSKSNWLDSVDSSVIEEIKERCGAYLCAFDNHTPEASELYAKQVELESIWANYQKANEWNPPHNHTGDLSFVIYIDNPIDYEWEKKHETQQGNSSTAGLISFRYGEMAPFNDNKFTHKPTNGEMFIFPAWLEHLVYPFNQPDIERISVAGNAIYKHNIKG